MREQARAEAARAIREEAWRQLAAHGPEALSLRAVARELGVVSSAVYRYYPSRRHLLQALLDDARSSLLAAVGPCGTDSTAALRWQGLAHAVRDWAETQPHGFALLAAEPPTPGLLALLPGPRPLVLWSVLLGLLQVDRLPGSPGTFFADAVGRTAVDSLLAEP
ncbi:TetR/AcrR family transcriptional regulator [Streptomyces sp. NPDC001380]|uniref:TetR/AcrR family transcriptional regulator n=1 Tax=Streptomyces sp. NPDC001380 TaxID=3364566 RepID=UPI00368E52B1